MPKLISVEEIRSRKLFIEKNKNIKILTDSFSFMNDVVSCLCGVCGNEWETFFYNLHGGTGCPLCKKKTNSEKNRRTKEEFDLLIDRLKKRNIILNLNYLDYVGDKQKLKFTCGICGNEWETRLTNVVGGTGCTECARNLVKCLHSRTESKFIEDKNFILEKRNISVLLDFCDYKKGTQKVKCLCNNCGNIWESMFDGLVSLSRGCPKCKIEKLKNSFYISQNEFFTLKEKLFDYFIIVKSDYSFYLETKKVECECSECGYRWEGKLLKTAKRNKCPKCLKSELNTRMRKTDAEYQSDLNRLLESGVEVITPYQEYINAKTKLQCVCRKCNSKWAAPLNSLLGGFGCLQCSLRDSKFEKGFIEFLQSVGNFRINRNDRDVLDRKEIDVYLSEYKIGFELHGLYWHSEKFKKEQNNICKIKFWKAKEKNIKLIQIFEDEWKFKQDIVKKSVLYRLGMVENKISTRKCTVIWMNEENKKEFVEFVNRNHVSGWTNCKLALGLMFENKIVSVLSFRKPFTKKYDSSTVEIARFCSDLDYVISGSLSKLLSGFIKSCYCTDINKILTYADLRFGCGEIYLKNGFEFCGETLANYYYTDFKQRFNRFKFRAQKPKTEKEVAEENNVFKIYDAGSYIYMKTIIRE